MLTTRLTSRTFWSNRSCSLKGQSQTKRLKKLTTMEATQWKELWAKVISTAGIISTIKKTYSSRKRNYFWMTCRTSFRCVTSQRYRNRKKLAQMQTKLAQIWASQTDKLGTITIRFSRHSSSMLRKIVRKCKEKTPPSRTVAIYWSNKKAMIRQTMTIP